MLCADRASFQHEFREGSRSYCLTDMQCTCTMSNYHSPLFLSGCHRLGTDVFVLEPLPALRRCVFEGKPRSPDPPTPQMQQQTKRRTAFGRSVGQFEMEAGSVSQSRSWAVIGKVPPNRPIDFLQRVGRAVWERIAVGGAVPTLGCDRGGATHN